ncbi:hypothetical protein SAMD00019534_094110, partial [Acytostelium subglobosum LB1]|uniref:hypothetical protein n=1 Tax=Acytostelium subglobosum LB1 TaxID=1410327 RepID=UPI0006451AC3
MYSRARAITTSTTSFIQIQRLSNNKRSMSTSSSQPSTTFVDHFGKVSDSYRTFRPTYPPELFEVLKKHTANTPRKLAFDIGCGTGQATVEIAKFFEKVIGFDPSAGQIGSAVSDSSNVEYKVSPAECIDYDGPKADLITVAQAAHWFDLPKFFGEVNRLLQPDGSLIIWCYGTCSITDNDEINAIHMDYYSNTLGDQYWPANRKLIDRNYEDIIPPFPNTTREQISFTKTLSINSMIGYYGTWSGYNKYKEMNNGQDPLPSLKQRLIAALGAGADENTMITLRFPVYFIISKFK